MEGVGGMKLRYLVVAGAVHDVVTRFDGVVAGAGSVARHGGWCWLERWLVWCWVAACYCRNCGS